MNAVNPRPIVLYGRPTCQDTALSRARLAALGVELPQVDVLQDPSAAELVQRLNGGSLVTPTFVLGAGPESTAAASSGQSLGETAPSFVAEPTLAELDELLQRAGYDVTSPVARQLHDEVTRRPLPGATLPRPGDGPDASFNIDAWRGRSQVALFLPHGPDCFVCRGYGHALLAAADELRDAGAEPLVAVPAEPSAAAAWLEGEGPLPAWGLVADPAGAWRDRLAAIVELDPGLPALLLLDRFQAPRVVSGAAEAGGLISPEAAAEWLRYLALECPECSPELPWA